jgi:hypothetical protein
MPKCKKAVVRRQESEFRIKDTAEALRAQRNSKKIFGTLPYFQRRQRLLSLVKELVARFWMLDTSVMSQKYPSLINKTGTSLRGA